MALKSPMTEPSVRTETKRAPGTANKPKSNLDSRLSTLPHNAPNSVCNNQVYRG